MQRICCVTQHASLGKCRDQSCFKLCRSRDCQHLALFPRILENAAVFGIQISPSLVCVSVIWPEVTPAKSICEGRA